MSIVRTLHNKENPYVQINRKALWDENLSLEAAGLWARLLSRPDDWRVSVIELSKSCKCGKDKIYRILQELIDAGYAYREQPRVEKGNRKNLFGSFDTFVFEFKMSLYEIKEMFPQRCFPLAEVSVTGNTDTTNKKDTNKEYTKEEEKREPPDPLKGEAPPVFSSDFQSFGQFVRLKSEQYEKLVSDNGEAVVKDIIDQMTDYMLSTGKKPTHYKDYAAAIRQWIRRTKESKFSGKKSGSSPAIIEENKNFTKEIGRRFPDMVRCRSIDAGIDYIEFNYGGNRAATRISFNELAFKDQVVNALRKMNLPVEAICR